MKVLFLILRDPQTLHGCLRLFTLPMIFNMVQLLPESQELLSLVLILDDFHFSILVQSISTCLCKMNQGHLGIETSNIEEKILANAGCLDLFCKVAYRMLQISNSSSLYLEWFFGKLMMMLLEKELSSNVHFKTKLIEAITRETIALNSSVAFLFFVI